MAENGSKLYDIMYPSPIPLTELSSIAVAVTLWHLDLNDYLKKKNFVEDFYHVSEPEPRIPLKDALPELPSAIFQMIKKYVQELVRSTYLWLKFNYDCTFKYHRGNQNEILKDFNDIVCDFDGTIHYDRTAKRMMLCDRISQDEKFKIACVYSFEEDIRRIWPSVRRKVNLDEIIFRDSPCLCYWVCSLRNKFNKIPIKGNILIVNFMLKVIPTASRSSFTYFWNLAKSRSRYKKALQFKKNAEDVLFLVRFVLPKLNENQLTKFAKDVFASTMLYKNAGLDLAIWIYIKDNVVKEHFLRLFRRIIFTEIEIRPYCDSSPYMIVYSELWIITPDKLKRFAIEELLSNEQLLTNYWDVRNLKINTDITFLLTVLRDMSLEERSIFLRNYWIKMLCSTCIENVRRIMKLCFADNEYEINRFKKNIMAQSENIDKFTKEFLTNSPFKELNKALNFIYSGDEKYRKNARRKCIQSICYNSNSVSLAELATELHSFRELMDNAYADLPCKFRNQFFSPPHIDYNEFRPTLKNGYIFRLKKYVDLIESVGDNAELLKMNFACEMGKFLVEDCDQDLRIDSLAAFMYGAFGSNESAAEFKQLISPHEVLLRMMQKAKFSRENKENEGLLSYPYLLDPFLSWYFDSQEEVNEFKTKFTNIFQMFAPPSARRD